MPEYPKGAPVDAVSKRQTRRFLHVCHGPQGCTNRTRTSIKRRGNDGSTSKAPDDDTSMFMPRDRRLGARPMAAMRPCLHAARGHMGQRLPEQYPSRDKMLSVKMGPVEQQQARLPRACSRNTFQGGRVTQRQEGGQRTRAVGGSSVNPACGSSRSCRRHGYGG